MLRCLITLSRNQSVKHVNNNLLLGTHSKPQIIHKKVVVDLHDERLWPKEPY